MPGELTTAHGTQATTRRPPGLGHGLHVHYLDILLVKLLPGEQSARTWVQSGDRLSSQYP